MGHNEHELDEREYGDDNGVLWSVAKFTKAPDDDNLVKEWRESISDECCWCGDTLVEGDDILVTEWGDAMHLGCWDSHDGFTHAMSKDD